MCGWDQRSHSSGSSSSRGSNGKLLTGIPGAGLKAAHIWPARQAESFVLEQLCLTTNNVSSPRNGLLLLASIEDVFDKKQICFIYDPFLQQLKLQILDPSLGTTKYHPGKKFADLQGQPISLPANKFPFRRLLSAHAWTSFSHARQMNWVSQETFDMYKDYAHLSDIATQNNNNADTDPDAEDWGRVYAEGK